MPLILFGWEGDHDMYSSDLLVSEVGFWQTWNLYGNYTCPLPLTTPQKKKWVV